jgi:hypothetical protein
MGYSDHDRVLHARTTESIYIYYIVASVAIYCQNLQLALSSWLVGCLRIRSNRMKHQRETLSSSICDVDKGILLNLRQGNGKGSDFLLYT